MRHADPVLVTRLLIEIEAESFADTQADWPLGKGAHPELGPLQIGEHGDRPPRLALDGSDNVIAGLMVRMRAVAEVEAEHVRPDLEQSADGLGAGAGRPQRRDDLGLAMTMHGT